jgi:hypothetical protein
MITHVRFRHPVSLGGTDHSEWSMDRPHSTPLAGKITARAGNPDLGEPRDSIVFECRIAKDHYDVEVPRSNIAHIIRPVVVKSEGKKP